MLSVRGFFSLRERIAEKLRNEIILCVRLRMLL